MRAKVSNKFTSFEAKKEAEDRLKGMTESELLAERAIRKNEINRIQEEYRKFDPFKIDGGDKEMVEWSISTYMIMIIDELLKDVKFDVEIGYTDKYGIRLAYDTESEVVVPNEMLEKEGGLLKKRMQSVGYTMQNRRRKAGVKVRYRTKKQGDVTRFWFEFGK